MVLNSRMGCSYQHLFEHQTNTAEQEMSARGITWKEMVGKSLSKLCLSFTNFEEHARHSYTRQDGCQCPPLKRSRRPCSAVFALQFILVSPTFHAFHVQNPTALHGACRTRCDQPSENNLLDEKDTSSQPGDISEKKKESQVKYNYILSFFFFFF